MMVFIHREMRQHMRYSFNIIIPVSDMVLEFGEKLKPSHIAYVPQEHRQILLIINLPENTNKVMPSVHNNTCREVAQELM